MANFGSIYVSFWCALGTLGASLGAIGHYLGNLVDPRVKIRSSCWPQVQLRLQFGIHLGVIFLTKVLDFLSKLTLQEKPTIRINYCFILCRFSDPGTLIFELSPARELNFQKTQQSTQFQKSDEKCLQKGSPQMPQFAFWWLFGCAFSPFQPPDESWMLPKAPKTPTWALEDPKKCSFR